ALCRICRSLRGAGKLARLRPIVRGNTALAAPARRTKGRKSMRWLVLAALLCGLSAVAGSAYAAQPEPWALGLQDPATGIASMMDAFHDELVVIISAITVLVMALLAYVIFRYREAANPTPSKRTHNTLIEIVWTVVPVLILMFIAIDSFKLLYAQDVVPADAELTIRVTG